MAKKRTESGPKIDGRSVGILVAPEQLLSAYFKSAPVGLAVLDDHLRYQVINSRLAAMSRTSKNEVLGRTLREVLGAAAPPIERTVRSVLKSGTALLNWEVSAQLPRRTRPGWWLVSLFPLKDKQGRVRQVGALAVEITRQKHLESRLKELSSRLLQLKDEERRRISRELHDVTGQNLAGLIMTLASLKDRNVAAGSRTQISHSLRLAREIARQVRTMSYVLHPPMLDEFGLSDALRWYIREFAERSRIKVDLHLTDIPRLPQPVETACFRTVQQALNNALHHARTRKVEIRLRYTPQRLSLTIRDFGRGISHLRAPAKAVRLGLMGVGIASMRERLEQVGGALELDSTESGTLVNAFIPLPGSSNGRKRTHKKNS